jgi:hypothetical protein
MSVLSLRIALRLLLCAGCAWLAWRFGGLVVMVCTAPLFGVALARPLVELASDMRHHTRAAVWMPLEGRHFAYRGLPVQVIEDERHTRWVCAADVRRIVGFTANDRALALTYPNGWQLMGRPAQPHFSDDALIAHLRKETAPAALHFRHWAEREIAFPARRVRARLGIRPNAAEPADIA